MSEPGIKQGYPNARSKFGNLADYMMLTRPFTVLPAFIAGVFGVLIQLAWDGRWPTGIHDWAIVLFIGLILMLCQAVGQIFNNVADVGPDSISKPYRPIPSGRLTVKQATYFGVLVTAVIAICAAAVDLVFATIIYVILFFAIFYNLNPIRAKRFFPLNLAWMSISRGLLPFLAAWSVMGNVLEPMPWILGIFATLWTVGWQATKDFQDIDADRAFNLETLPVKYGADKAAKVMCELAPLPFIFLIVLLGTGVLPWTFGLLFSLVPVAVVNGRSMYRVSKYAENNVSWAGFYIGLGLIYLLGLSAILI